MQQATPTNIADPPSCADTPAAGSDAAVRVVTPVGGRGGWRAVDADTTPGTLKRSGVDNVAGDDGARAWLRDYVGGSLERDDRILLILYYFEGLNAREIAAVIDATEASVGVRLDGLNRALQTAFRGFLREQSDGQAADG